MAGEFINICDTRREVLPVSAPSRPWIAALIAL
jgi:hypothetical protein